jgi:hypothetical protein
MRQTFHVYPGWVMVFNATFNNISVISWRTVLWMEKAGLPEENHFPVAIHWQTLSYNVVSSNFVFYLHMPRGYRVLTFNKVIMRDFHSKTNQQINHT